MSDIPQPDNRSFEELTPPEQRAAIIFSLAGNLEHSSEEIADIEQSDTESARVKFIAFAKKFYPLFQGLSEEDRTNQNINKIGDSSINITRAREGQRTQAVSVLVTTNGTETAFNLPEPESLDSTGTVWSSDSMPIAYSKLITARHDDPLFQISLVRSPSSTEFAEFARYIESAAEFIVAANSPDDIDLREAG